MPPLNSKTLEFTPSFKSRRCLAHGASAATGSLDRTFNKLIPITRQSWIWRAVRAELKGFLALHKRLSSCCCC